MPRYIDERKEAVLAKLLLPHRLTVKQVAERENISEPTIYKWRHEAREQGQCFPDSDHPEPEGWTSRDEFSAVVETADMNAQERSEYCRSRGLYTEQLERWRVDCEQAADLADSRRQTQECESKTQRRRIKTLEKELHRKGRLSPRPPPCSPCHKNTGDLEGVRGRMISTPDRRKAIELIDEARANGARL